MHQPYVFHHRIETSSHENCGSCRLCLHSGGRATFSGQSQTFCYVADWFANCTESPRQLEQQASLKYQSHIYKLHSHTANIKNTIELHHQCRLICPVFK